ncbi:FecR family protein [Filimonas effusa]|nr:FecR family protein [Filimonas effusa]
MESIDHLIEKFWLGEATAEEKQRLMQLLEEADADLKLRLEKQYHMQDVPQLLSSDRADAVRAALHAQIGVAPVKHAKVFTMRPVFRWAVAAIAVAVASVWVFRYHRMDKGAVIPVAVVPALKHDATAFMAFIQNTGDAVKEIVLEDGSIVRLEPGSGISYHKPFDSTDRGIVLKGNAFFKVAKNKLHPFSVRSEGYVTTALGTSFLVATGVNIVKVQLFEGKVVVRSTAGSRHAMGEIYLKPGQELAIQLSTDKHSVMAIHSNTPVKVVPEKAVAGGLTATHDAFVKEPLGKVFDELAVRYKIAIHYKAEDVKGLSFTGELTPADNYQAVLDIICSMNDLTFKECDQVVTITKK